MSKKILLSVRDLRTQIRGEGPPVRAVDGHAMPAGTPGPVTQNLRALYESLKDEQAA